MAIISDEVYDEQCRSKNILRFSREFKLGELLNHANIRKAKGIGVLTVFVQLLMIAFSGKPLSKLLTSGEMAGAKDVFYRIYRYKGKLNCLIDYCAKHRIGSDECIAVGDGSTDIPLFEYSTKSIAINYSPSVAGKATHYINTQDLSAMMEMLMH